MKKITIEWLYKQRACEGGIKWFASQSETDGINVVEKLIAEGQLSWANWLIVRIMDYRQYVSYAVYAAERVIDRYEVEHPEDKRPRQAIEAARKCIADPSEKNTAMAAEAAMTARAAWAAEAAWAAWGAEGAEAAMAAETARAAWAARGAEGAGAEMLKKILTYGLSLLGGER